MIIGRKEIDYVALRAYQFKIGELVPYVEQLVPKWARNIKGITDNQKYYVAIHLRNVLTIPFKTRRDMLDALLYGVNISGICTYFIDIHDIVKSCDTDILRECLKEKLQDGK